MARFKEIKAQYFVEHKKIVLSFKEKSVDAKWLTIEEAKVLRDQLTAAIAASEE